MMLEVARAIAQGPERPRRSVMFVGFDLEEIGLYGSRYFVEHPPVPLDRIALFLTADMIGRALGGVCEPYVFVMGTEHSPGLRPWIERAARDRPITVGLLGTDLLMVNRSDYGPFRAREVPFLFFSTGENPRYHTPHDTPETLELRQARGDQPARSSAWSARRPTPRPSPSGSRCPTTPWPRRSPSAT